MLNTKPETLKLEFQEREDTPSQRELYELILEIGIRQSKIEEQLTRLTKWVDTKRKKLSVIDWLNENYKLEVNFEEWQQKTWLNLDRIHLETIFQYDYIEGMSMILREFLPLENEEGLPIKSFDQKDNALFIYTKDGWIFMNPDMVVSFIKTIDKHLMKEFSKWQEENKSKILNELSELFTENVQKVIGGHFTREQIYSRVKRNIFKHLKMNLRNVIQYEFTM